MIKIPFNKPFMVGKELKYISQAVASGKISGDGYFTHRCQKLMEHKFGAKKILLTTSCTAALEMSAILCGVKAGDEVIMPSFTFVSTANAFCLRGAKIKFVDIRPDTYNLDETKLEKAITAKTKAIVPVHYAGISCEMKTIRKIARKYNLLIVEDAAQGVNASFNGKYLGTMGDLGTYSFHETKNFICGEGGALVINNDKYIEQAEIIREKGTNRSKFFRGEVDKYTWVDIGSSFLPSDLLAAFLYAQLENMEEISYRRKEIYNYYYQALQPLAKNQVLQLPLLPPGCHPNYHLFPIIMRTERERNGLMDHLRNREVLAVFHYLPLHLSPMGRAINKTKIKLPVTESISKRLLRLPFYYSITASEQRVVIRAIKEYFNT